MVLECRDASLMWEAVYDDELRLGQYLDDGFLVLATVSLMLLHKMVERHFLLFKVVLYYYRQSTVE